MLNPADHTYQGIITGELRRSVTTILAEEGYIQKRFFREGFQDLGVQVHKMLHAYDMRWKFTAPSIYLRYLAPWQALLKHTGAEVIDSEVEGEEPMLRYAGQLDKLLRLPGHGVGLLDIKISQCGYIPAHEYQTEGYRQMLRWHPKYQGLKIDWRGGIILGPDCTMPKIINHDRIKGVEKVWQAICICNADKHRHKNKMEKITAEEGWF